MRDLDHHVLAGAENTNSWCARKGHLQCAFPLDVLMVPSSVITIAIDGERLTCDGFSLDKTVHLGNFEFIADYFSSLSLSPKRGAAGVAFMGSTLNGASTPWQATIEDSTEEFLMASCREGSFAPLLPDGVARGLCLLRSQPHYG
jgi:hypothetical protein